ncbi:MAG: hypothetical protein DRQ06_06285 [Candidatus Hydrothermota bacterium]|nr:MAG: hypothetical protein DRQ06_06285 [Candidatus Hydrothermae bacterium]
MGSPSEALTSPEVILLKHKQLGGSHRGKDTEKFQVHMIIYAKAFAIKKLDGVGSCNLHDPTPFLHHFFTE